MNGIQFMNYSQQKKSYASFDAIASNDKHADIFSQYTLCFH